MAQKIKNSAFPDGWRPLEFSWVKGQPGFIVSSSFPKGFPGGSDG